LSLIDAVADAINVPAGVLEIVVSLGRVILDLVRSSGDEEAQRNALMTAQEETKRLLDKRKFGTNG
jgi:hypothetical protein